MKAMEAEHAKEVGQLKRTLEAEKAEAIRSERNAAIVFVEARVERESNAAAAAAARALSEAEAEATARWEASEMEWKKKCDAAAAKAAAKAEATAELAAEEKVKGNIYFVGIHCLSL